MLVQYSVQNVKVLQSIYKQFALAPLLCRYCIVCTLLRIERPQEYSPIRVYLTPFRITKVKDATNRTAADPSFDTHIELLPKAHSERMRKAAFYACRFYAFSRFHARERDIHKINAPRESAEINNSLTSALWFIVQYCTLYQNNLSESTLSKELRRGFECGV